MYSGEACLNERVIINSKENNTIGRYCGKRYYWSVYAASSPILLEFHISQRSKSQFFLQCQITGTNTETYLNKYKNCNDFKLIENLNFFYPFSWNHVYILAKVSHLVWNIIVPKMYIISLRISNVSMAKQSIIIFDGLDINSNLFYISMEEPFIASSFQVSILCVNVQHKHIEMIITNNILKNQKENYQNITIKESIIINSEHLPCVQLTTILCAFKLHTSGNAFSVNITLLSFMYSGPNVGYCKYGGFSVYDIDLKEVLLLCNNIFPVTLSTQPKQVIVSSTQSLFLIFYAYWPYGRLRLNITMKPTRCKGVHLLRYNIIIYVYVNYPEVEILHILWLMGVAI